MLSDDFEVFYYSDTHFSSVDLHAHDYYEFYFFAEGEVSMEISGTEYVVTPGDMIIIPPGVMHRAVIRDGSVPYRRFVLWITPECCSSLISRAGENGFIFSHIAETEQYLYTLDSIESGELREKLYALIDEIHSDKWGRDTGIELHLTGLLFMINRTVHDSIYPKSYSEDTTWHEIITGYIREHLTEDLSLERISRDLYLSKYYIAHLFRENTGLSLHQYITKKRLSACCEAMLTGDNITVIYQKFGFNDYSSFYRAFRKEYHTSPADYRELHRVEAEKSE